MRIRTKDQVVIDLPAGTHVACARKSNAGLDYKLVLSQKSAKHAEVVLSVDVTGEGRTELRTVTYCIFSEVPFELKVTAANAGRHALSSQASTADTTVEALLAAFDALIAPASESAA